MDTVLSMEETEQSEDDDGAEEGISSEACAGDSLFITYKESLSELLQGCRPQHCIRQTCSSTPTEVTKFVGTAAVVKWVR